MRKKLAMLAFLEGEGPWIRAAGNESIAQVHNLFDYEELNIEVENRLGARHLRVGDNELEFLRKGEMYRFIKRVPKGQQPSKTCVEVILNGSSRSRSDAGAERG